MIIIKPNKIKGFFILFINTIKKRLNYSNIYIDNCIAKL